MRFQDQYVRVRRCAPPLPGVAPLPSAEAIPRRPPGKPAAKSNWMKNFSIRSGPSLRPAIEVSNART